MNSGPYPENKKSARNDNTSVPASSDSNGEASSQNVDEDVSQSVGTETHPVQRRIVPAAPAASAQNGKVSPQEEATALLTSQDNAATSGGAKLSKSPPAVIVILGGIACIVSGVVLNLSWLTLIGALLTLVLSWGLMWPSLQGLLSDLSPQQRSIIVAIPAFVIGLYGLSEAIGINRSVQTWSVTLPWTILGSFGDFLGAIGQIFVALLALFVAWRQYIISRDLTVQQNRITQQQTIDAYFQGISDLVLDDEGLLEDWPQERIIAEARTAAILSSIDAPGKAKIIRFLSRSKLLTPLKRDEHLGRPILDGKGGYAEDRERGVKVIDLGAILANANLGNNDLRWTDLSDVNLIRADLSSCDLVRTNFVRTILYQANLAKADIMGAKFFHGSPDVASPRSRIAPPSFETGEYTGAVVEDADFSNVKRMSEEQRQYCCRWGGEKTRETIPGGCEGIPNCLGR
ncbi:pentapeptide repeat-containing protein [Oscillatoria sp. CS-180]|uniref:pentapeptide repeat-containing protein n=1 Tax=Oscillatoria sp. CS-180 TaxID=3021720 RepID=UPI00232B5471|nr:pentapeptide repeat-containing protein [Oscillatoria sp. CS-180]MDB9526578.1 pentapeptide repeat-containing protein [Oscillatoria sp. CS-180]